jgi:DDE superfamily endonuclease
VARLKRKQYVTFVDVLRPKADSYCKLMTGLSQHAVRNLWDRYGCHFEDEQFGVAQPTPPQIVPTVVQEAAPRESDEGNSSSSRATRSEEEGIGRQGYVRRQGRKPNLAPADWFYLVLRGLRTGESQVLLGERFGISKPSACRYFLHGIQVLMEHLVTDFLVIPNAETILKRTQQEWFTAFGNDTVVLTVDGTHFEIDVPEDNLLSWLTYCYYKGYNSQQTVLVVDSSQLIVGITGCMAGRAHELSHVWSACGLQRILMAFKEHAQVALLADKAYVSYASFDHVTVRTPPKSRVQFTREEVNQTRVVARYRVKVEHVIGQLKNWSGLFSTAAMRFSRAVDGVVGSALVGGRDWRLFVAAALWNASQLDGVPLEDTLGSAICLAPRVSVSHGELVERFPTAISRRVNGIRLVEWAWLLPTFHIDANPTCLQKRGAVWCLDRCVEFVLEMMGEVRWCNLWALWCCHR